MAGQEKEKRYQRVKQPKIGVEYSALDGGVRHIVRMEARHTPEVWTVIIVATGQVWHIAPKSLETALPM